jgi:hypothetical protein
MIRFYCLLLMKSISVVYFILAVRLQMTTCPGDQLHLLISLNGIDPNFVLLGDSNCKPTWFNDTHAQFTTPVDNCSLVGINDDVICQTRLVFIV